MYSLAHRRHFIFRDLIYNKQLKKLLQLKLSISTTKDLSIRKASFISDCPEITLVLRMQIRCLAFKIKTSINFWHLLLSDIQLGTGN
jgi:hypothetical protein